VARHFAHAGEYWGGNWDVAVHYADEIIAAEQEEIPEVRPRTIRGQIRLARGRCVRADARLGPEAVDELARRFAAERSQQLSASLPDFVIAAVELGRADAFLEAIGMLGRETPWIVAARAYPEGDFETAAATYARIGSRPDAAYANLRLAASRRDADAPLQEALAFYRSVGAMRYIREGEALLAAAS